MSGRVPKKQRNLKPQRWALDDQNWSQIARSKNKRNFRPTRNERADENQKNASLTTRSGLAMIGVGIYLGYSVLESNPAHITMHGNSKVLGR